MIDVGTGVPHVLADRDDAHHTACVRWLATTRGALIVPPPVIAEACYLIARTLGPSPEAAFLDASGPSHASILGTLFEADLTRMAALVRQYADRPSAAPPPPSSPPLNASTSPRQPRSTGANS